MGGEAVADMLVLSQQREIASERTQGWANEICVGEVGEDAVPDRGQAGRRQ